MTSTRDNTQHGIRSGRNFILVHKGLREQTVIEELERGVEKPRQKAKKYLPANRGFMLIPGGILSLPRLLFFPCPLYFSF